MPHTFREDPVDCEVCPVRRLALFRELSREQLLTVREIRKGQEHMYPGTIIFREGARVEAAYTLFEGWVMRYKTLEDGRRQIIGFVLPGDFLGFHPYDSGVISYSAEALSPVTLCTFPLDSLGNMLAAYPELSRQFSWLCRRQENLAIEHMTSIGRRPARERIAHLLLELDVRVRARHETPADAPVLVPLTQEHIADTLGLTSIHVSRTLRTLREDGLLEFRSGRLNIKDRDALVAMTGFDETVFAAQPQPLL
ncbi:MAG: Crp/Fnr family transcriptional regulator [Gammaproteobacteria bacterium]|nr:Crp/Fnr family transcriptional regulator [Gammaproteobacteria bacterium]